MADSIPAVLAQLAQSGVSVRWRDGKAVFKAAAAPPADIVTLIDARKAEVSAFLHPEAVQCRLDAEAEVLRAQQPPDVTAPQWEAALRGLRSFIELGHADEALRLGWPRDELYAVPPLWSRVDLCGAALAVGDREIVNITSTEIRIADRANCAIELVHHVRKTNGKEITHEDGRGASSLVFAARSVRVLNPMSTDEAQKAKVEIERKGFFFRADIGKANLAPPSEKATWYNLKSVPLGNGTRIEFDGAADDIMVGGDTVGVIAAWDWPEALEGVDMSDIRAVRAEIAKGKWKRDGRASDWVGIPIAIALKLDASDKGDRAKIASLIAIWIKSGMLKAVISQDSHRHNKEFVEVGEWA